MLTLAHDAYVALYWLYRIRAGVILAHPFLVRRDARRQGNSELTLLPSRGGFGLFASRKDNSHDKC